MNCSSNSITLISRQQNNKKYIASDFKTYFEPNIKNFLLTCKNSIIFIYFINIVEQSLNFIVNWQNFTNLCKFFLRNNLYFTILKSIIFEKRICFTVCKDSILHVEYKFYLKLLHPVWRQVIFSSTWNLREQNPSMSNSFDVQKSSSSSPQPQPICLRDMEHIKTKIVQKKNKLWYTMLTPYTFKHIYTGVKKHKILNATVVFQAFTSKLLLNNVWTAE